jgi:hypothetical protein
MRTSTVLGAVVLVLAGVAWQLAERGHGQPKPDGADDAFYEEILRRSGNQDVAEWRKSGQGITIGEQNAATSAAVLDAIFAAGAVRIVATDVQKDPSYGLTTNWLVVELPKDPVAHRQLELLLNRLAKKDGWGESPLDPKARYSLSGKFKSGFSWP